VGWMQSTGQTSTQEMSLVPMQGSLITYAKGEVLSDLSQARWANVQHRDLFS